MKSPKTKNIFKGNLESIGTIFKVTDKGILCGSLTDYKSKFSELSSLNWIAFSPEFLKLP